ncbi:MAG TPA: tetratricopeptide repeat protein [Candidatus Marinimicrobia bacterium]|nr:tetratricopeptide repeat protein [Candidatus Neomarinimicrobiota bacterium]HRS51891.1 tetratricopeptide repeat protein [Candidatus Neomarinimicrobiota bacterium]HRU93225.1 tetratricopeptide repeat protein [Candidatus Neomarinimicrobiota bacterium]
MKFGIFSAVRKYVFSLLLLSLVGLAFSASDDFAKLPDGLQYRQVKKNIRPEARPMFKAAEKYYDKMKYSQADQSYLEAIQRGEGFYGSWGRACVARQDKRISDAEKFYATAFSLNDSLESFLYDYAVFLQLNGQEWGKIEKVCTRLYTVTKDDEALSILVETAARLKQQSAALKSLAEIARRYPLRSNAQVYYASMLYDCGQKAEAAEVARNAIQISYDPFQLKLIVSILAQEGYFVECAKACQKMSQIAPRSAPTLEAWGFLELQQGHYKNAATYYKKALNRDYRIPTLLSLARIYAFYLNEPERALHYAKAITNLDRDNCDALYIMAEVKRRTGDINGALKYSARLIDLQPEHPQTYYYHGKLLFQNKDYKKAVQYLEKAVQYNPDIKRYRLVLAKAYAGAGMPQKARATYANYLNEPLKDLWQEENMLKGTPPPPR